MFQMQNNNNAPPPAFLLQLVHVVWRSQCYGQTEWDGDLTAGGHKILLMWQWLIVVLRGAFALLETTVFQVIERY